MSWFFYAVMARLFWAGCNLSDHYVTRRMEGAAPFTMVVAICLFIFPIMAALAVFYRLPVLPPGQEMIWIVAGAAISLLGTIPYLAALRRDEAYNITPLFEFTPVFVMILGFALLGENMGVLKFLLGAGCIAAGFFFLWDFERGHIRTKTLALMIGSALCYAVFQIIIRHRIETIDAYDFFFWLYLSIGVLSVVAGIFTGDLAKTFHAYRAQKHRLAIPSFATEAMSTVANFCIIVAMATAPTAGHVAALSGLQPVFVFTLSQILSYTMPGHYPRLGWTRDVQIKLALLAVMIACAAGLKLL